MPDQQLLEVLWLWIALPLLVVATVILTFRLGFPQIRELRAAFAGLRDFDPRARGSIQPALSFALSSTLAIGAAGAVGSATAVSLGGAGAVFWVWVFAFALAPLRMAETALARTAPPGKPEGGNGSLAGRLLDDELGGLRAIGWILLVLLPLLGVAFWGGVHGSAAADAADELVGESGATLVYAIAAVAAVLAFIPFPRWGRIAAHAAAGALVVLLLLALGAFLSDPSRAFGAFGQAFLGAIYGAPRAGAFIGALAGEVVMAATLHLVAPVAATSSADSAIASESQSSTTRSQAKLSMLAPLGYGLLATILGLAHVTTGVYSERVEDERAIRDVRFLALDFDSISQRLESGRGENGVIRVNEGSTGVVEIHVATDRGMMRSPRFYDGGEPANIALRLDDGEITILQRPNEMGALISQDLRDLDAITVRGSMLPQGARLVHETLASLGALPAKLGLVALLLIALIGTGLMGEAIRQSLQARLPSMAAQAISLLPAAGVALAAARLVPELPAWGAVAAALVVAVVSAALIVRAKEVSKLLR